MLDESYRNRKKVSSSYYAFSMASLVLIIVTEPWYRQGLFDSSLDSIIIIQSDATETAIAIWKGYTNSALIVAMIAPIIASLLRFHERCRTFYYVVMLTAMLFIMNVSKLCYWQARPFWVWPAIQAFDCSVQYGNPSGHSLFSMGTALTIWLDYNSFISQSPRWRHNFLSKVYTRGAFLVLAITFSLTIGYSRIFLGVHTWNQLLFGWQLGIWLALTLHFCFKDSLMRNLESLYD